MGVGHMLDLGPRVALAAQLHQGNNLFMGDDPCRDLFSSDRVTYRRPHIVYRDVVPDS